MTVADLDRGQKAVVRGTVPLTGGDAVIRAGDAALEFDATAIRALSGALKRDSERVYAVARKTRSPARWRASCEPTLWGT